MPLFDSVREKPLPPMTKTRSATKSGVYHERMKDGTPAASRKKVLALIALHGGTTGSTIQQTNEKYGVPINEASGRTSELVDLGHVVILGHIRNPKTNRPNTLYRAVTVCLPGATSL